ncbi:hypothetical protein BDP27DRAFT_1428200 [Rhodocollybia butyracea]|uniref:Uncharacterized protein n=1 Tax=Rhodocollybia butyracea TaxID=206335 RepID=A0A9P5U171_9AGAR|nr:hypothetical protein BDP27DRAFT_1428200 [Rhodocollybia butyracea]
MFWIHSLNKFQEALHKCSSLESLVLTSSEGHPKLTDSKSEDTSCNINSFSIKENPGKPLIDMIFSSCTFPSLNELQIERMREYNLTYQWPSGAFISLISRSSCVITTFSIRGISISASDLIAALHVMPSLLSLEVEDGEWHYNCPVNQHQSPINSVFITRLAHRAQSSAILVPKLHSLHLLSYRMTSDADCGFDLSFIDMVESRWFRPGSDLFAAMSTVGRGCIRSVEMKFARRNIDPVIYKPLRVLDEEGLRVVVSGMDTVVI